MSLSIFTVGRDTSKRFEKGEKSSFYAAGFSFSSIFCQHEMVTGFSRFFLDKSFLPGGFKDFRK